MNLKEEKYNSSKDIPHAKLFTKNNINEKEIKSEKQNEERQHLQNKEQNLNSEDIYIRDNSKEEDINICEKNNIETKKDKKNDNEKNELLIQNNKSVDKNKTKNDENYQISLNRVMIIKSNTEIKPSLEDDSSSISENYNLNSVKSNKNNNLCLSSDKNISFFIENNNNNNNINRFLINDIQLEHNDKVIKELASELEQSTAKKDKLSSNQKEIESKFKTACNNIEPINLLGKKEINIKLNSYSNKKDKVINNNAYQVQSINNQVENKNSNKNDQEKCHENIEQKVDNNVGNYESKSKCNINKDKEKDEIKVYNDKYKETKVDNNYNKEKEKDKEKIEKFNTILQLILVIIMQMKYIRLKVLKKERTIITLIIIIIIEIRMKYIIKI